jgi:glycosyltransferase involved in cell wall biosynthesis
MKVLFQARSNLLQSRAGDTIQVLKTREYLEKLGVKVELSCKKETDLRSYDLVHIFHTNRINETYQQFCNGKKQGKPVAISTIYWDMRDYLKKDKITTTDLNWWVESNMLRKEVFAGADILLPNSEGEYLRLSKDLQIENQFHVVPNCVDRMFLRGNPRDFISEYGIRDFVLCVGRISYRKNQLSLIRALKETGIPVVFIGSQHNRPYLKQCKDEAKGPFYFIDEMPHHRLPDAYAAARLHVLPSWFETPGLASLEAALAGCNVVTTPWGTTREYFKDLVLYCKPDDLQSIRDAVLTGLRKDADKRLQQFVFANYTWEKAAEETLNAYQKIL